jgi:hypothetical protein
VHKIEEEEEKEEEKEEEDKTNKIEPEGRLRTGPGE